MMAASYSLNSLTQVMCDPLAFKCFAAVAAGATDGLYRYGFPTFSGIPLRNAAWIPKHRKIKFRSGEQLRHPGPDFGRYSQRAAIVRIPRTAMLPEHIVTTIQISPGHEDALVIQELVPTIKETLSCMRHSAGEISVSAYDTAWVARIPDPNGSGGPHFPCTLEWIVENQHPDGSWGDSQKDWLYDRFIQTLACIVTLKSWTCSSSCVQRGIDYLTTNADKLEDEEILSMPIGFELAFPSLLAEAKNLGLNLPYNTPFFGMIEKMMEKKLQRISLELLHSKPTTILHTLEGLQSLDIDWERVLKFQAEDGSICCSPAATAALYMRTGNKKSLSFLESIVRKFNHAVPTCYTLDNFHNLWVVDTLERLGISRYFQTEIEGVLARIYREWSDEEGMNWSSMLEGLPDLDDTSMAFRLLRQHGYNVSAEGFKGFQKGKSFACFPVGQTVQGVSDMFNLYRASQTAYPGEERLADAESFSRRFLIDALANRKGDADKWSLKKDLSGEVEYVLRNPEYKSLNRMQVSNYLDKYGPDDVWIGKTLYRLPLVNNSEYLKLAKADFNLCQMLHQKEVGQILRWISDSLLSDFSNTRENSTLVTLYTMFSAELWEPQFSAVRIATGKLMCIAMSMQQLLILPSSLTGLQELGEAIKTWDPSRACTLPEKFSSCFMMLYNTVNEAAKESSPPNDLLRQLVSMWWQGLLSSFQVEAELQAQPPAWTTAEALKVASMTHGLKAVVFSSILMSGEMKSPQDLTWMENDSNTLIRAVSEAVGLAQGIISKKDSSVMQSDESHLTILQLQMAKELNLQLGHMSKAPSIVKRLLLSIAKVANCYCDGDYEQSQYLSITKP